MGIYFETKDLAVGYHGKPLIHDISVSIEKGEIVTLIGPNGSGKSTILKSITKHLATIHGTVYVGKDEIGQMSYKDLSKKMAVVLTERIKPELMTCRDVVASGRYPYTNRLGVLSPEDEEIVNRSMEQVNVLELSQRSYEAISDGQRQRILLARAICQQPEIIILDEPTSFLDIRHKVELLGMLRKMAKESGTTVIMSLHEIDLAEKVSDKILCVKGDIISRYGTPEAIFKETHIHELYSIEESIFNIDFGSIELPKISGKPDVFVISACGSGIDVYRRLQKDRIPFYAGILYTNDVDYQVAKSLATDIAAERPFVNISDGVYNRAMELMNACSRVIVCDFPVGECNKRLLDLLDAAKGKIVEY
ncbi:MAG: ABC transporter ATP-binding protein [Eubacterium sp.]|nr:ABC transporter ATP-binding protein [Eubacterium sp.]